MITSKKFTVLGTLSALPLVFWLSGASAGSPVHIPEPNMFKKAERMLSHGEADSAIELLGAEVDDYRRRSLRAKGHALLCNAYYQKQDFVIAEEHCDQSVILDQYNWSNLNNRGVMRFLLGRFEESLTDFNRASSSMLLSAEKSERVSVKSNIKSAHRQISQAQANTEIPGVVSRQ